MFVFLATSAQAQPAAPADADALTARLSADKIGDIETGSYSAGDDAFSLDLYGDKFLLRFADNPETFVLNVDRVTLGGRVLKYDTGATALRVSVWGGVTLYTQTAPDGLPATRTGDSTTPPRQNVSDADLSAALRDETSHLSYVRRVNVRFSAQRGNDQFRTQAFDALLNAGAGIESVVAGAIGHAAFVRKIEAVKLVEAAKPGITLSGRTLTIRFVSSEGPAGRPSSHAVAAALGKFLAIQQAG